MALLTQLEKFASPTAGEVLVHEALMNGRQLVALRCLNRAADWVVECDVHPLPGRLADPEQVGPHVFPSRKKAEAFIGEALLSLQYLGCEIAY